MKKMIFLVLILGIFLFNVKEEKKEEEIRGVFISYIELGNAIKGKEEKVAKKNIREMIQKIKDFSLNTIILQVRPGTDAIYPSKIFPYSHYVSEEEGKEVFDILDYFIQQAHEEHIKLFAWVNPYRIRTNEDRESITSVSPAYPYLDTDTIYVKNGIFWNPSKQVVTDLIVSGIQEILEYSVDGILFDDYFYMDSEVDLDDYEFYKQSHPNLSLQEYHLEVVNRMIERVHQECQKKHVKFGISPDGNMDNNYNKNYADVKRWMRSENYIDFIIPQIYYGFYNSTKAYTKVIREWESFLINKKIEFYIALAFYKVGKEDIYAKDGRNEWLENDNIIMREVLLSRNLDAYKGFFLFRYDSIFNHSYFTYNSKMERENLKKVMK